MSKFGELIDVDIPVLLDFFTEWNEQSTAMHPVLRDVAAALGDKAKVIKIDVDKNKELAEALRVKEFTDTDYLQKWRNEMASQWRTRCEHFDRHHSGIRLNSKPFSEKYSKTFGRAYCMFSDAFMLS